METSAMGAGLLGNLLRIPIAYQSGVWLKRTVMGAGNPQGGDKMKQYIQDLTTHLISKNHYDGIARLAGNADMTWPKVREHIWHDLEHGPVREMRPETLGKVMCAFDIGDVMAGRGELADKLYFSGDCEEMLRSLVALCLAYVILDRLDPTAEVQKHVPPYKRSGHTSGK